MPFQEPGTQESARARDARAGGSSSRSDVAPARARAGHRADDRHPELLAHRVGPAARCAPSIDDLLSDLRPGHAVILRSTVAPGTTEFVAGYIEKRRGLRAGERRVRRTRARADRRRSLPRRDHIAAVHRRRRRRRVDRARGSAVRRVRRSDRPHDTGAGGAREDLDEHPALRDVRAPEPADDGLRALRRERVRGDRADQP